MAELKKAFSEKRYRDSFVENYNRQLFSSQIRRQRGCLTQSAFGKVMGKSQTQVARFEDPTYGLQSRTIYDIAARLDVAALVCLVDFDTFLDFEKNRSESSLILKRWGE